ncbi:MAG: response regulator [Candidatus Thiodiazotropha taylori]|nr:response regulator [Candidatus Thiodiazotropha taylori]
MEMANSHEILIVDDNLDTLRLIVDILHNQGYEVRASLDPEIALKSWLDKPADLALLDVKMPGMDGFELCCKMKAAPQSSGIPILFISASTNKEDHIRAFKVGAVDYISKPINQFELIARVNTHIELSSIKRGLERKVEERTAQLRELSAHLINAREEERASIAREIHDEIGGSLTAIKLTMNWLKKQLNQESLSLINKVEYISDIAGSLINVVRRIVTELRPSILDDLGLWAAIEWQASEFEQRTGINCSAIFSQSSDDNNSPSLSVPSEVYSPEVSIAFFRILQEALTNTARHASATKVIITWKVTFNQYELRVSDNGIGFDVEKKTTIKSNGIRGMLERASSLGGDLTVLSGTEDGTEIIAKIPIDT